MLETFLQEKIGPGQQPDISGIEALLKERNVNFVSFEDWKLLDAYETDAGQAQERPRVKVTSIDEMLEIIREKNN